MPAFCRLLAGLLCFVIVQSIGAQEDQTPPAQKKLPEIADAPKTIDPATLMPPKLAESATVDLSDSSFREVVAWLQDERKITVLVEQAALAQAGILPGEPVSERLVDTPVYLLLNRLRALGLAWHYDNDVLHFTSPEESEDRLTTAPYNIGDLRDAGYDVSSLDDVVRSLIAPDSWDSVGGLGAVNFLGDVMFVRQTDETHRTIQGLLAALRKVGRQTFVYDPPQHLRLRQRLRENVSVDFQDTSLVSAVNQLAETSEIDIRLDSPALRDLNVREREPVTLRLTDRKLETVLQALVLNLKLTWILRDGVLWITSTERAEEFLKTAVYDVRDLCRDDAESTALSDALTSQTDPDVWDTVGGPGAILFVKPGIMVILNTERIHAEVLDLLETYRAALRASRRREPEGVDQNEIVTVYYRLHADVAKDLATLLPQLVQPESWKSEMRADAPGEIHRVASNPEVVPTVIQTPSPAPNSAPAAPPVSIARAVLIVRQTRAAHDEIAEIIRRVESGDAAQAFQGGAAGGGFGGGGFGGFGGSFF